MVIALEQAPNDAAIHGNGSAVDVAGALGGEEGDHGGKLFGLADAAGRNLTLPPGINFLGSGAVTLGKNVGEFAEAVRAGVAGADVVDGNTMRGVFIGQGARKASDGGAHRVR